MECSPFSEKTGLDCKTARVKVQLWCNYPIRTTVNGEEKIALKTPGKGIQVPPPAPVNMGVPEF